jgi:hypothetical protein
LDTDGDVRFLHLRRRMKIARRPARAITPRATPTPIPAEAPGLSPREDVGAACEIELDVGEDAVEFEDDVELGEAVT